MRYLERYLADKGNLVLATVWIDVGGGRFERIENEVTTQSDLMAKMQAAGNWGDAELLAALHCDGWWVAGAPEP